MMNRQSWKDRIEDALRREAEAHQLYLIAVQQNAPYEMDGIDVPQDSLDREDEAHRHWQVAQTATRELIERYRAAIRRR
ncbi:MAG: hypothetical protein H6842_11960 [Rhodospirillaceae bacterium]|nr:hypothetical protein [Rhodospirillaceae bacterium]